MKKEREKDYSMYSIFFFECSRFHNNDFMIVNAPVGVKPVFLKL